MCSLKQICKEEYRNSFINTFCSYRVILSPFQAKMQSLFVNTHFNHKRLKNQKHLATLSRFLYVASSNNLTRKIINIGIELIFEHDLM